MSAITLSKLSFTYGTYYKPVFKDVTATIDTDWKLGLIGRNGRGKTTLLKLIHGSLSPDSGEITKSVKTEIFPYDYNCAYTNTLDILKENIGGFRSMESTMTTLLSSEDEKSMMEYARIQAEYEALGGYTVETDIHKEIAMLGLDASLLKRDFDTLSGGEQTKLLILALFLRPNHFILLDEPTNHLDIEGKRILAEYLAKKKGFIVITHDRKFLDTTVNHIIAINKSNITIEKGNYTSWHHNKTLYEAFELRTKTNLEKETEKLEDSSKDKRHWSGKIEGAKNPYKTHNRGTGARSARLMKSAKMLERRMEKHLEAKRRLLQNYETVQDFDIDQDDVDAQNLITLKNISFGYDKKMILSDINMKINKGDAIWLKGKNGSGKTTLIKIITGEIQNFKGERTVTDDLILAESKQLPIWQFGQIKEHLNESDIDADRFKELLKRFDLPDELYERPIESFSSGEQKKIDIARALSTKNHLLILDEPLNYMDIQFRGQLEKAMIDYKPTVVFVEHDEWFGEAVGSKVFEI
ncbi:MAG: ATP-binding cassette domain-containing protein [Clostridiales bacterium]|nr:ATP-binding cassette domain-containing protein [Clostridiales bacterium]